MRKIFNFTNKNMRFINLKILKINNKKSLRNTFLTIILTLNILLLHSCKDENVIRNLDLKSTQSCNDYILAQTTFNTIGTIVQDAMSYRIQGQNYPNYQIINSDTTNLDTLIVNFGPSNYLHNTSLLRGKINITYTGAYRDSLSVITITLDNFYLNNNLIQGTKILQNFGKNNQGNTLINVAINDASINTVNGTIDFNSNYLMEWTEGYNTYNNITDDSYIISGELFGNNLNGNDFNSNIISPLHYSLKCYPNCLITSGEVEVNPVGYSNRIINFGDSICDCKVNILIDNETYPITIYP